MILTSGTEQYLITCTNKKIYIFTDNYLDNQRYLLLTGRLDSYLADLNEQAQERFDLIEAQMRSAEGVTEELKRQNPMEWVRHCNNICNQAAEIIKQELIYV